MADQPENNEENDRRSLREKEWGQQFDMWLIKAARTKQLIELCLTVEYPGVTKDGNLVDCIPIRIDKYMIEILVDSSPVWIQKKLIAGCKRLGTRGKSREEQLQTN